MHTRTRCRRAPRRKTAWRTGDAYTLPIGWTWADLPRLRREFDIPAGFVPIAFASSTVGWGAFIPGDTARMRALRLVQPPPGAPLEVIH